MTLSLFLTWLPIVLDLVVLALLLIAGKVFKRNSLIRCPPS